MVKHHSDIQPGCPMTLEHTTKESKASHLDTDSMHKGGKHKTPCTVLGWGPPGGARARPLLKWLGPPRPLGPPLPFSHGGPCRHSRAAPHCQRSCGREGDSQCQQGWPPPPQRSLTHLREQTVWTGLWNRDRQPLVWKSQRRSMLGGRAWAEASREPLPSNARAETWGGGRLRSRAAGLQAQASPG